MTIRAVPGTLGMVVYLSVFGCGATEPGERGNPGPHRVAELEGGLRSKSSVEAVRADYVAAIDRMADQIAALLPGAAWKVDEDSWGGCSGEYAWTRAVQLYYRIVLDRAIPDDVWARALQVVKGAAARFGATNVDVFVDQPGNKDLAVWGSGAQFRFGSAVQTVLTAVSDCRMQESDTATSPRTRR